MEKKLSETWWNWKKGIHENKYTALNTRHKPTYDKILSLEAKIEEIDNIYHNSDSLSTEVFLLMRKKALESELQQIKEQEGL